MKKISITVTLLIFCCYFHLSYCADISTGKRDPAVLVHWLQGAEKLSYRLSWSGGIKIGEMHMVVKRSAADPDKIEIIATVVDSGLFRLFYPVNDTFLTVVQGEEMLPVSYTVQQKEGRSYTAKRHTEYEQSKGIVRYQKNDQPVEVYQVDGTVYNEFSSFLFTRFMVLDPQQPVLVPTFADGERHKVVVYTKDAIRISNTVLGDVTVIPVQPVMHFKGLYDKDGDTEFWLTDDPCRIPVRINSEIALGSLTAELISYSNPECSELSAFHLRGAEDSVEEIGLELGE